MISKANLFSLRFLAHSTHLSVSKCPQETWPFEFAMHYRCHIAVSLCAVSSLCLQYNCCMYVSGVPSWQVISEEHTASFQPPHLPPARSIAEVDRALRAGGGDISLPLDELTVWVDPLDATQEFTGLPPSFSPSLPFHSLPIPSFLFHSL